MDKKFVLSALGYGIVGLLLGIYMAATKNHGQLVTHAHIMLLGFVVSFIYGALYKVWLPQTKIALAMPQYICHQIGTIVLVLALFCLYGGFVAEPILGPILGASSILVLAALVMMKIIFIKHTKS